MRSCAQHTLYISSCDSHRGYWTQDLWWEQGTSLLGQGMLLPCCLMPLRYNDKLMSSSKVLLLLCNM